MPDYFPAEFKGQEMDYRYTVPAAIARDGRLYFRKDTKLISIDGSTLEQHWEVELGEPGGAASMGGKQQALS